MCPLLISLLALVGTSGVHLNMGPVSTPAGPHGVIRISEFLAVNKGGLADEDGDTPDWIEIHNSGGSPIDLAGWHLTDDVTVPFKWTFPTVVLPADGYLVVFASDKDRAFAGGELHTNFKLSSTGEFLALVRPDLTVESSYAPSYPEQGENVSYGLRAVFDDEGYLAPPTPGAANDDVFAPLIPPKYSSFRGLYSASFDLALTHAEPGVTITYTLDGSDPVGGGTVYTAPITVDATATVRSIASKAGYQDSPARTHSYVFPADVLLQSQAGAVAQGFPSQWIQADGVAWDLGGARPGAWYGFDTTILNGYSQAELEAALGAIPTVSLTMASGDWFGDASSGEPFGIYCNSEADMEKEVSLEWIDPSGGPQFGIRCGVTIDGGSSTAPDVRNQLSFDLAFRGQYGTRNLEFPVFDDGGVARFDGLVLDAGYDNSPNAPGTLSEKIHAQGLRDSFLSGLQQELGGLAPRHRPVHVYLNGLYWGVYDLHEEIDDFAAASHEGGIKEQYDWIKEGVVRAGNDNPWDDPTAPGAWETAVAIASNGLAPGDLWQGQPAYEAFQEWFDVEDYADYLILNYYAGNVDWPSENWMGTIRARLSGDWTDADPLSPGMQWHSWDGEEILWWGGDELLVGDGVYDRTGHTSSSPLDAAFFYTKLRENPEWRVLFADRAHRHLAHGALHVDPASSGQGTPYDSTAPDKNRPATIYHDLAAALAPAIALEYARWGNYWHSPGFISPADWAAERDRILEDVLTVRSSVLIAQLQNVQPQLYPDLEAPRFKPWGGSIGASQTVTMTVPGGSTVYYTTDGSDPRLEGGALNPSAIAYAGPFVPPGPTVLVSARAFDGTEWSALESAGYAVGVRFVINELMAKNRSTIYDEFNRPGDWVELKNAGKVPVDLTGWGLSDDPDRPGRWRFPDGLVIAPGGYLLIWCDDDETLGPLHANFKLSSKGEQLLLSGPAAAADVVIDQITFGKQKRDRSLGRIPDGTGPFQSLADPSPLAPNFLRDRSYR